MAQQRMALWAAEADIDEDLQDVDLSLAIGSYAQNGHYEDGMVSSAIHLNTLRIAFQHRYNHLGLTSQLLLPCNSI